MRSRKRARAPNDEYDAGDEEGQAARGPTLARGRRLGRLGEGTQLASDVKNRLFLGGGDLSYELSYVKKHPSVATKALVTTYDDEEVMNDKYPTAAANKSALIELGVEVQHGIDATQLKDRYPESKFKTIHFSHPHTGSRKKGESTSEMLGKFFKQAESVLEDEGKVIMPASRVRQHYGLQKKQQDPARDFSLNLERKHGFGSQRYRGYVHKETLHDQSAESVATNSSVEYVWKKMPTLSDSTFFTEIATDSGSEAVTGDES